MTRAKGVIRGGSFDERQRLRQRRPAGRRPSFRHSPDEESPGRRLQDVLLGLLRVCV
jgi:hypothetical protein